MVFSKKPLKITHNSGSVPRIFVLIFKNERGKQLYQNNILIIFWKDSCLSEIVHGGPENEGDSLQEFFQNSALLTRLGEAEKDRCVATTHLLLSKASG